MSLSILVLDFWAGVSDYLQRSTLSSLRARSVPASYPAERSALALRTRSYFLTSSRQLACLVPNLVFTRKRSVSGWPIDCAGKTS